MISISIIAALGRNRVIGKDNELPWMLPGDMKHFMDLTMGHPIIMGRKTHQSIGEVLPGRENIVLSREKDYSSEGCVVMNSLTEVFEHIGKVGGTRERGRRKPEIGGSEDSEVFVIGGGEIFRLFFPHTDRLYLTLIDHDFVGDVYFPALDADVWREVNRMEGLRDPTNPYRYHFITYFRG